MMSVKSSSAGGIVVSNASLSVWQDCPEDRDRLILRDGSRVEDPVLLVYCGGPLPRVTARGPAMLVEFRSAATALPLGASNLRLELETQVVYVDSDGLDYAQTAQGCYFFINGTAKRSGVLRAPLHALPPGTNCTWNVKGALGDRIWLYFASYSQVSELAFSVLGDPTGYSNSFFPCILRMGKNFPFWHQVFREKKSYVHMNDSTENLPLFVQKS